VCSTWLSSRLALPATQRPRTVQRHHNNVLQGLAHHSAANCKVRHLSDCSTVLDWPRKVALPGRCELCSWAVAARRA
jgi:hypothetical protein